MQAEHIAAGKQGVKIHELHTVGFVLRPNGAGAHQHLHAKGLGNAGGLPANAAVAIDAKGLAQQFHLRQQTVGRRLLGAPMAVLHKAMVTVGALADGQQQAEGHLCHTVSRIARHVGYRHAMAAAGLQIKVIRAGGNDAHPPELRALGQNGFVDAALIQEHDLRIPDARHHLFLRGAPIAGDVRHKRLHTRPVQISLLYGIIFQNHCFHFNFLTFTSYGIQCQHGALRAFAAFQRGIASSQQDGNVHPVGQREPYRRHILRKAPGLQQKTRCQTVQRTDSPQSKPLTQIQRDQLFCRTFHHGPPCPLPGKKLLPGSSRSQQRRKGLGGMAVRPGCRGQKISA